MAAAGGVQTAGIESVLIGLDIAAKRESLTNEFRYGWSAFAELTGIQTDMGGDRSALETRLRLGDIAFGGEYTVSNSTFGILANIGTGDVDYYGVKAYAAHRFGDFNLVGQIGWMMTSNDIAHSFGDKVDLDTNIYTVGARGEWACSVSENWRKLPYLGLNYLHVDTDAQSSTKVGDAVMSINLDVWTESAGRVRFGLKAVKDNMAFGVMLGGAAGDNDYREIYGQINTKYVI